MLPSSQSDDAIYARSVQRSRDELDTPAGTQWVNRSSSLHTMTNVHVEYSEDDEQQFEGEVEEDMIASEEIGAARSRDPPTRKTKPNDLSVANPKRTKVTNITKATSTAGIRSRRKLREQTPDVEVDVE